MQKAYSRINWENDPSTNTPINEDNLNKMDYAIDTIDSRVVSLYGYQDRVSQSEVNAKASENNAKASETNAKASEELAKQYMEKAFLGTPDGYSALVEQVGLLDIAESTGNTLYNTKAGGYRLQKLLGNTEQKTLSGKNLSPVNVGGSAGGFALTTSTELEAGETYYISFVLGRASSVSLGVIYEGDSEYTYDIAVYTMSAGRAGFAYTPSKNVVTVRMYLNTAVTFTDFQIEKGEVMTDYEPYCGGIPSPNPNYPQSLNHTNDVVEMVAGAYAIATGAFAPNTTIICNKNPIPCKSGDTVKILTETTLNKLILYYNDSGYMTYASVPTTGEITIPSGVTKFNFRIEETTPDTVGKITLTINGKYVGCVKGHGKNFINPILTSTTINDGSITVNKDKSITLNGTFSSTTILAICGVEVEIGESYILSGGISDSVRLDLRNSTNGVYNNVDTGNGATNVAVETKMYPHIRIQGGTTVNTTIYPMLRKADILDDTYEPYKETIAWYFTEQPPRLGDFLFKDSDGLWKVEHNVTEVVFDGSSDENWQRLSTQTSGEVRHGMDISPTPKPLADNATIANAMCTDYRTITPNDTYKQVNGFSMSIYSAIYIYDTDYKTATTAEWKARLQANPITVMYELATPTIEVLDAESQIALNSLETFDTVTYIEVDSRVQPLGIEGQYGTSQVGALALENANLHDTVNLTTVKGSIANNLTTTEEGFVLDARQGKVVDERLVELETSAIKIGDIVEVEKSTTIGSLVTDAMFTVSLDSGLSASEYKLLSAFVYSTNGSSTKAALGLSQTAPYVSSDNTLGVRPFVTNNSDSALSNVTIVAKMTLIKIA